MLACPQNAYKSKKENAYSVKNTFCIVWKFILNWNG